MMVFNISHTPHTKPHFLETQWQFSEIMTVPWHRRYVLQQQKIRKIYKTRIINSDTEPSLSPSFYGFNSTAVGAADIRIYSAWCLDYISFVGIVIWWFERANSKKSRFFHLSLFYGLWWETAAKSWLKILISKRSEKIFSVGFSLITF